MMIRGHVSVGRDPQLRDSENLEGCQALIFGGKILVTF